MIVVGAERDVLLLERRIAAFVDGHDVLRLDGFDPGAQVEAQALLLVERDQRVRLVLLRPLGDVAGADLIRR